VQAKMPIRLRRPLPGVAVLILALTLVTTDADARVRIKFFDDYDSFFFHAQIYDPQFRARTGEMRIEARNAAGPIYSVTIPAGGCVSRSAGSCVYKNPEAKRARNGLAFFRVLYQAGTHGNKVWLQSYGDLSAATDPVMSFVVYLGDVPYASTEELLFTPTHNGWVGF
jgi:hypothetical protein